MKKFIYIAVSLLLAGAVSSCSKDDPFGNEEVQAYGRLLTTSLDVSLHSEYGPKSLKNKKVRQKAPDVKDFTVEFFRENSDTPEASYLYSEMPEIVTLPVGNYVARAFHGENPEADWEKPYYMGESKFTIEADQITDEVDPIKCTFANVRVSIDFTDNLKAVMGDDCKVTVKVGDRGSLDFTVNDTDRSGYFAHVPNSTTLVATFTGVVDGAYTTESKSYTDVAPGKHYAITFRLHDAGEEDPGSIDGDDLIVVDATVTVDNMNSDVDSSEEVIDDDMRPTETPEQQPDEPNIPDNPQADAPQISAEAPVNLDIVNELEVVNNPSTGMDESKYPVVLNIVSTAEGGIKEFKVKIKSDKMSDSDLTDIGLAPELDMVNPGDTEGPLRDLGFPVKVGGFSEVKFDITSFIPMLCILGSDGHHEFTLTVTDANGTTTKTLRLHNKD